MTTTTKLIIIAAALLIALLLRYLKQSKGKISEKTLDDFYKTHSVKNLSEKQKRLLAFGAVYSIINDNEILAVRPVLNKNEDLKSIQSQWGVTDNASAMEVLNNLIERKRTQEFDTAMQIDSAELEQTQTAIAQRLLIDISTVKQTESTYAWDICRAVNMAKRFYCCDLISETEMWTAMEKAVAVATQEGKSWTDYTVSFLLGRTMHGFGMEDVIAECRELLKGQSAKIKDIDVYKRYSFN